MLNLIEKYLAADTTRKQSAAKGALTRWANNRAEEIGSVAARTEVLQVLAKFQNLPEWIIERFNPKSFYKEGDRVMGWYDPSIQVQAEELPLYHSGSAYSVSFYRRQDSIMYWRVRGFEVAQEMPTIRRGDELKVEFDVKQSRFWLNYGYALACDLQWRWREGEEFYVSRSIISSGFWCAYKWWEGCKWWYYEKHPEWFEDDPMWGDYGLKPVWCPAPDEYSTVLGGTPAPH